MGINNIIELNNYINEYISSQEEFNTWYYGLYQDGSSSSVLTRAKIGDILSTCMYNYMNGKITAAESSAFLNVIDMLDKAFEGKNDKIDLEAAVNKALANRYFPDAIVGNSPIVMAARLIVVYIYGNKDYVNTKAWKDLEFDVNGKKYTVDKAIQWYNNQANKTSADTAAYNYIKAMWNGLEFNGFKLLGSNSILNGIFEESVPVSQKPPKAEEYPTSYSGYDNTQDSFDTGAIRNILSQAGYSPNEMLEYQLYPRRYYSGSDAYIWFNNQQVEEVVAISYQLQENNVPIYGYASYTWDAVAHGQRLVTGTLRINFTETWFLRTLMAKLSLAEISSKKNTISVYNTFDGKALEENKEKLRQILAGGDVEQIKLMANEMESYMWGNPEESIVDKYDNPFFSNNTSVLTNDGFDIIISWGSNLFDLAGMTTEQPGTVTVINGVHFTGVSTIVQPNGDPVYEEYSFIARDLNNTVISEQERKSRALKPR